MHQGRRPKPSPTEGPGNQFDTLLKEIETIEKNRQQQHQASFATVASPTSSTAIQSMDLLLAELDSGHGHETTANTKGFGGSSKLPQAESQRVGQSNIISRSGSGSPLDCQRPPVHTNVPVATQTLPRNPHPSHSLRSNNPSRRKSVDYSYMAPAPHVSSSDRVQSGTSSKESRLQINTQDMFLPQRNFTGTVHSPSPVSDSPATALFFQKGDVLMPGNAISVVSPLSGNRGSDSHNSPTLNENSVKRDYIVALINTLKSDSTHSPDPDDFQSKDGYSLWQKSVGFTLQQALIDILQYRFIEKPAIKSPASGKYSPQISPYSASAVSPSVVSKSKAGIGAVTLVDVNFKVIQARNLISKQNRPPRDSYCKIEFGHFYDSHGPSQPNAPKPDVYFTNEINQSNNPVWNVEMKLKAKNLTDKIVITVLDKRKDDFLGQARLSIGDLITSAAKEGYISRWYPLTPRESRHKDKYVGGEILIEMSIDMDKPTSPTEIEKNPYVYLESQLVACKILYKSLYKTLLRSCLTLDLASKTTNLNIPPDKLPPPPPNTHPYEANLLSDMSKICLKILARAWAVSDATQWISLLELLFQRYKRYQVPVWALLNTYEVLYSNMKKNPGWLGLYDKPTLVELLEEMNAYYKTQIMNYKEFYPKNKPDGALASTVLMLRMIFKNILYRECHQELPESFRKELKYIMEEACRARYQKLIELTAPLDENDLESVIGYPDQGLIKLTELLMDEIDQDASIYSAAFGTEIDILFTTGSIYMAAFINTIESYRHILDSREVQEDKSGGMFQFYRQVRALADRYFCLIPRLKKIAGIGDFNAEKYFSSFISSWLDQLSHRTMNWVDNAIKADQFTPVAVNTSESAIKCSSSIMDIFTAIYVELDLICELKWENNVENAKFLKKFAKTINSVIEQYCDSIGMPDTTGPSESAASLLWGAAVQTKHTIEMTPVNILVQDCVKLCNIEFALEKLRDMYCRMNVDKYTNESQHDYPKQIQSPNRNGTLKLQVLYAENIKAVNKSGFSNPYVVARIPESMLDGSTADYPSPNQVGSISTSPLRRSRTSPSNSKLSTISPRSSTLISPSSPNNVTQELARTRIIYDNLNPHWNETFINLFPSVAWLSFTVYSKHLVVADEVVGTAFMRFEENSRAFKLLSDHHTHDFSLDLEPQGRLFIRMTLEGGGDDVKFWLRKSREKLIRTKDEYFRNLGTKLSPYVRHILSKAVKDQEAAPRPSKNFFSSLTASSASLSDKTTNGTSINQAIDFTEADSLLEPLTNYLNRNLETLSSILTSELTQQVIEKVWDDILCFAEQSLIPQLFGQIERDRRILNIRQVSVIDWILILMKKFFHHDGDGVNLDILENKKYHDILDLMRVYFEGIDHVKYLYEESLMKVERMQTGEDYKVFYLRLVRLYIERGELKELIGDKQWLETQLYNRQLCQRASNSMQN